MAHLRLEVHLLVDETELTSAVRSGILSSEELYDLACEHCAISCGVVSTDDGDAFMPFVVVIDRTPFGDGEVWYTCDDCALPVTDPTASDEDD